MNIHCIIQFFYSPQISKETVVCSRHFKKEDFKFTPVRKTLINTSVPSVFEWGNAVTARRELIRSEVEVPKKKSKILEDNIIQPIVPTVEENDQCEKENNW